jgi:hypothetical protein
VDHEVSNLAFHDLTSSSANLPATLKRLLGLNLNFCPTPRHISTTDLLQRLPDFARSIRLRYLFRNNNTTFTKSSIYVKNEGFQPPPCPPVIEATIQAIEKRLQSSSWISKRHFNMTRNQRELLKALMFRHDIKVLLTDKNLGPAIMTSTQYVDFCLDHLQDTSTYRNIQAPPDAIVKLMKSTLKKYYKRIFQRHGYDMDWDDTAIICHQVDSRTVNVFYALAKIHKPQLALRPIVSNANGVLLGLSKWLDYHLQPLLKASTSYLKSSDQLLTDFANLQVMPQDQILTFDVVSLYTSIPIDYALETFAKILDDHRWKEAILEGLHLILRFNYFQFGDTMWHQVTGTAMGTPVAPAFASLYLAHFEIQLAQEFQLSLVYFRRYIDDGLIIWRHRTEDPYALQRFFAKFTRLSRLKFTHESSPTEVPFLDLWIIKTKDGLRTKTHQKALNLYLYLPAASAHPPGVLKGLIYGLVKKYALQNPDPDDFKVIVNLLLKRLQARGYRAALLLPIFRAALEATKAPRQPTTKVFFKIPYDPNGPSSGELKKLLDVEAIEAETKKFGIDQVSLCYLKPPTLKRKLCPTRLPPTFSPTPATRLALRSRKRKRPDCTEGGE